MLDLDARLGIVLPFRVQQPRRRRRGGRRRASDGDNNPNPGHPPSPSTFNLEESAVQFYPVGKIQTMMTTKKKRTTMTMMRSGQ